MQAIAIQSEHPTLVLNFVVDFKNSSHPVTSDVFGNQCSEFDVTEFGFDASEFELVTEAILNEIFEDYFDELENTVANQNGMDLQINFMAGDIGTAPQGVSEYYFIQVGSVIAGPHSGVLGVAGLGIVRSTNGTGPNFQFDVGDVVGSVFTNNIQKLGNLSPSNALSSGNLTFTRNAIAGTISHEIGHTLSLSHANVFLSQQPSLKTAPIMGTGAIDLSNQLRLSDREFSLSAFNAENGNSQVFHIHQLAGSVGVEFQGPIPNDSLAVISGVATGGLSEINFNFNDNLEINIESQPTVDDSPIVFEFESTSPDLTPNSVAIRIESRANTIQTIEIFDTTTSQFVIVDQRQTSSSNFGYDVPIECDASKYVDQVTCKIRCRISYSANGPVLLFPWKTETDLMRVLVNQ